MPQCITVDSTTLDVATLEESEDPSYIVRVNLAMPKLRIYFAAARTPASVGSIDGIVVTPPGPEHGANWVEFNTSQIDTIYTVQVTYSDPPQSESHGRQLAVPSKSPKFKPRPSCPTHEE